MASVSLVGAVAFVLIFPVKLNQTLLAPNHIGLSHVPANMTEALSINTAMSEPLTIKGVPLFVPSLFLATISKSVPFAFAPSIDPLIIQREFLLAFVPE
ncbi:hypothetical protein [Priestia megaterium]